MFFIGWFLFCLLFSFLLFFLHVELFFVFSVGLASIIPMGFSIFKSYKNTNTYSTNNNDIQRVSTPQNTYISDSSLDIQEKIIAKKTTIKKNGKQEEENLNFINSKEINKANVNNKEVNDKKDIDYIALDEALKSGKFIKSIEMEKTAIRNNTNLESILFLNPWMLDRFSSNKESILLVEEENVSISKTEKIVLKLDNMIENSNSSNTNGDEVKLSERIQSELNLSEEDIENLALDIKESIEQINSVEKSSTKETAAQPINFKR